MPQKLPKKISGRLLSLDYLRGYFVVVIIVDHLWRYPSAWAFISGEAKLWVTAAEGFVIISGFLIGYIRGFKGLRLPFITVAWKLLKRAILLYVWMVMVSLAYIWIEWTDRVPGMPHTPMLDETARSWQEMFINVATTAKPHVWIHFLYLYTAFLLLSIIVVALLRSRQVWLVAVLSLALYLAGIAYEIEWMKWQVIFFIPSIVGFYFEAVRTRWHHTPSHVKRRIREILFITTISTIVTSALAANAPTLFSTPQLALFEGLFSIDGFLPPRVTLAFIWFLTFGLLFERITPWLQRYTYGVLEYLGTHSLSAYIAHGLVICLLNVLLPFTNPAFSQTTYYSILGLLAILGTYAMIRLPLLRRVIPK
ncbi:MAG: OpgC domain-containing protein [Candidatus Saccharimonas sp.]